MTMTDPIADMLTRIRNANIAFHDDVLMPSSKLKEALARILEQEGYIEGWDAAKDPTEPGQQLTIDAEVHARPQAHDLRAQARLEARPPGLHRGSTEVPRVLGGMGIAILSTNQGLMTDREARRAPRRRRGPLPGLVAEPPCPESARSPSPSRPAST